MIDLGKLSEEAMRFALAPEIKSNAIIEFSQSTGEVLDYDDVGNPILTEGVVTPIVIECYLRRPTSGIKNQKEEVGTDEIANRYSGRLVNPKTYQYPFRANGEIKVTLNGRVGRLVELMELETAFSNQAMLPENLGQRIECIIEFPESN